MAGLFVFVAGPALVLTIGIVASLFSAMAGTRIGLLDLRRQQPRSKTSS